MTNPDDFPLVEHELDVLHSAVPLAHQRIIELGCGEAALARELLRRHPGCQVTALEVDAQQHQRNLRHPQPGLTFVQAGTQSVPCDAGVFDLALMLKSLHHVPVPAMPQALAEAARVVRPGGHLYVSEPVYGGAFNQLLRLFHDEGVVRQAAQHALDQLPTAAQPWVQVGEHRFATESRFVDFEDFERRLIHVTYLEHRLDAPTLVAVRRAFEAHLGPAGALFRRPMHVRVFQRTPDRPAPR